MITKKMTIKKGKKFTLPGFDKIFTVTKVVGTTVYFTSTDKEPRSFEKNSPTFLFARWL